MGFSPIICDVILYRIVKIFTTACKIDPYNQQQLGENRDFGLDRLRPDRGSFHNSTN